jgi:hypothetical protein
MHPSFRSLSGYVLRGTSYSKNFQDFGPESSRKFRESNTRHTIEVASQTNHPAYRRIPSDALVFFDIFANRGDANDEVVCCQEWRHASLSRTQ